MRQLCPETFVLKTAELSYPTIVQHPGTYFISKKQKKAPHTEPFVYQKKNYLEDFFLVVLEAVLTKVFLTKAEALLASVLLEEVLLLEEMLLAALFKVAREVS